MNLSPIPEYSHHIPLPQFFAQQLTSPLDPEYSSVFFATEEAVCEEPEALSVLETGQSAPPWATHVAIINRSKT